MENSHAECRGSGSAPAATAWRQASVPWIEGGARERAVGHALPAEFGCGGFTQKNRSLFLHARDRRSILGPRLVRIGGARATQRRPALGHDQVLYSGGYAIQATGGHAALPARFGSTRVLHRAFL